MLAALRAARVLGRAYRHQSNGRLDEAYANAQVGLAILRGRHVVRMTPATGSAIAGLTIVAEECAPAGATGTTLEDLADTLAFLRKCEGGPDPGWCDYIPFLEHRLLLRSTRGA